MLMITESQPKSRANTNLRFTGGNKTLSALRSLERLSLSKVLFREKLCRGGRDVENAYVILLV